MEVSEPCIAVLGVEVFLYHMLDKTVRHKIVSHTSFWKMQGTYIDVDDLNLLVYDAI
jgi:hypothetical protein